MNNTLTPYTCQPRTRAQAPRAGGFALIGAIGMLALFALLGTAYVRYMMIELEDTRQHLDQIRAQHLASGGIYAAIGEIGAAHDNGEALKKEYTIKANAYRYESGKRVAYEQEIEVSVIDESGRIDINHAPPQLLAAIGFDAQAIDKLNKAIPAPTGPASGSRQWLYSVDDLLTRNILNRRQFNAIEPGLLTTYTVEDHSAPTHFLNLNAADPDILAAIFGISDPAELSQLMAKRPFASWQDAVAKSGRGPSTLNVALPLESAFTSRCFRLHGEVRMGFEGIAGRQASASVEAVVLFKKDGSYAIRYWNERKPRLTQAGEGALEAHEASGTGASPDTPPTPEETSPDGPENETNKATP